MIEKDLKKSEMVDLDIYDFFNLIAKANASEMFVIIGVLEEAKKGMITLANEHKKKMLEFPDKKFDQNHYEKELTLFVQCFAMALYIDKKIELCQRRKDDLTPDCFKKSS